MVVSPVDHKVFNDRSAFILDGQPQRRDLNLNIIYGEVLGLDKIFQGVDLIIEKCHLHEGVISKSLGTKLKFEEKFYDFTIKDWQSDYLTARYC